MPTIYSSSWADHIYIVGGADCKADRRRDSKSHKGGGGEVPGALGIPQKVSTVFRYLQLTNQIVAKNISGYEISSPNNMLPCTGGPISNVAACSETLKATVLINIMQHLINLSLRNRYNFQTIHAISFVTAPPTSQVNTHHIVI